MHADCENLLDQLWLCCADSFTMCSQASVYVCLQNMITMKKNAGSPSELEHQCQKQE